MSRPLVIAGHASGVGKTTVATGLMAALHLMGKKVAPFKVGPDYIDPGYHRLATGVQSRNLDTWLTSPEKVRSIYAKASAGADVSVIEGVMGLFDGRAGGRDEGSTAEVARLTGGAVVLVVNCASLARSLAPLLAGFDRFDDRIELVGAILNNVGSQGHARILRDAAMEAGVPVWGEIPRSETISLRSRQLGLVPAAEHGRAEEMVEEMADLVSRYTDIDALLELTAAGGGVAADDTGDVAGAVSGIRISGTDESGRDRPVRIAVARDEAFCFYYPDGLEALEEEGAELVWFSPLLDEGLPACDGLYLGGGFPEVFAVELEANSSMRKSVAQAVEGGLPTYAECGGMIYLCRGVEVDMHRREMAGVIAMEARMTDRRQALGYVEARARKDSILLDEGERVRGHEFHWSTVVWQQDRLAYDCFSSRRPEVEQDGYSWRNLLASYVHIHFGGESVAARRFVGACARSRDGVR